MLGFDLLNTFVVPNAILATLFEETSGCAKHDRGPHRLSPRNITASDDPETAFKRSDSQYLNSDFTDKDRTESNKLFLILLSHQWTPIRPA